MASALPRKNYARIPVELNLPNLIEVQLDSFERLKREGLGDLFHEVSPIESYNKGMKLYFPSRGPESQEWGLKYWFGEPKHSIEECVERDLTYSRPLYDSVLLAGPDVRESIKQDIFVGDFPEMTDKGTFIINGTERVVVSQLIRSPGVYFEAPTDRATGRSLAMAKLIPDRGAWMEFETRKNDYIILKFNRKRTVPITVFLRALSVVDDGIADSPLQKGTDEEILSLFEDIDNNPDRMFIASTLRQEPDWDLTGRQTIAEAALIEFFKRMRPGDPATLDNARAFLEEQLFDQRHYDLERVGRYKLNQKLDLDVPIPHRTITKSDVIRLVRRMILINNGIEHADDIDHLGNRRVKTVGELIQNKLRIGLRRMERVIKERMSIRDQEQLSPVTLVNIRPVVAALREFFGSNQLSQFMDQTNPLAELRHKRTLSALGPGGLRRERAGFDVRDVPHSHYGRICPIGTPQGPNIGLIGNLATYAKVNEFGFVESPFRRVYNRMSVADGEADKLAGRTLRRAALDQKGNEVLPANHLVDIKDLPKLTKGKVPSVDIVPWVSTEVEYLSADEEDMFGIAQANAALTTEGHFVDARVPARTRSHYGLEDVGNIQYMDVSPKQIVSVATALIPFLEHDDAGRALMGANMQCQAVPLLVTDAPLVGTGVEYYAAKDSGEMIVADVAGTVVDVAHPKDLKQVHATPVFEIVVTPDGGGADRHYPLQKFARSNQGTCLNHKVKVKAGQHVDRGDILADGPAIEDGEMALGRNVLVAFMPWEGYNFEDAILLSERVVKEDMYTSIHIEEYESEARETKLGPEEITRDIPNVADDALRNLDERGIVYIGAEVQQGDILVGKITPKGETELSAEERLLRAIFGEKAREVRGSRLRVPHGERGIVVDVKVIDRDKGDELGPGVIKKVITRVAQIRKITVGDKIAGRHGNKGVVAKIMSASDMPFMADGTPVDVVISPLSVISRMNLGQLMETHLGWALSTKGQKGALPVFDKVDADVIADELKTAGLPVNGKTRLYDGKTGEAFKEDTVVGVSYILKLIHMVEDKTHARSTGPYSLVTQQALGGKAQMGGQRLGEMEVWGLESHRAAHVLQEMLTIKSDDIVGRAKAFEAIVKGTEIPEATVPESFKVLVRELNSLGLSIVPTGIVSAKPLAAAVAPAP